MIELTEMKGKELIDVKENNNNNEIELIFKEGKYIIRIIDDKFSVIHET
ncbi:MAG TPA: hypothetical protein VJ767_12555 [Nitrososphaeraceae archaeon]|jgi:hypothetical protein|nr:hypothetical protein [Nitrososphaeraceae archaeon]